MSASTPPILIGTASSNAAHKADLGRTFVVDGLTYRICKVTSTIASAGKQVVVHVLSSGQVTYSIDVTTTASNYLVAGVIPAGQTGSTGTTSLIAGDYFPLIVAGKNIAAITPSTTLLAGDLVATATVSGQIAIQPSASLASLVGGLLGVTQLASTLASTTVYITIRGVL